MRSVRFAELLEHLAAHEVDFVVVGMTAGILHGAPVTTVDVDIVHRRTPGNVSRLLGALEALDAVYRHDPRKLRPKESHLCGPGHQLLATTHGDLDCLGTIDEDRGYDELLEQSEEMSLSSGRTVRVLSLSALIDAKERSGRPKDLAALPVLRATLDEQKKRS
jgi:hypothetical protein